MRIALIDPPGMDKGLNVGLGVLAACLQNAGHVVQVLDLNNDPKDSARRLKAISSHEAIGISLKSFTFDGACRIARGMRRKDIICGGPHVTLDGIKSAQREL